MMMDVKIAYLDRETRGGSSALAVWKFLAELLTHGDCLHSEGFFSTFFGVISEIFSAQRFPFGGAFSKEFKFSIRNPDHE